MFVNSGNRKYNKNFVPLKSVKYKTPIDLYSDFLTKIVSSVEQLENTFNVVDSIGIAYSPAGFRLSIGHHSFVVVVVGKTIASNVYTMV